MGILKNIIRHLLEISLVIIVIAGYACFIDGIADSNWVRKYFQYTAPINNGFWRSHDADLFIMNTVQHHFFASKIFSDTCFSTGFSASEKDKNENSRISESILPKKLESYLLILLIFSKTVS